MNMNKYKCCIVIVAMVSAVVLAAVALATRQDGWVTMAAMGIIAACLGALGIQVTLPAVKDATCRTRPAAKQRRSTDKE